MAEGLKEILNLLSQLYILLLAFAILENFAHWRVRGTKVVLVMNWYLEVSDPSRRPTHFDDDWYRRVYSPSLGGGEGYQIERWEYHLDL